MAALRHESDAHEPHVLLVQGRSADAPELFLVPGAGGSVTIFHPLALALGEDVTLHGLQPCGLDGAVSPHRSVDSAAKCAVQAVKRVKPSGPYHLLGHSFGGWIVFEMACQLVSQGDVIGSLVLVDTEPPRGTTEAPETYENTLLHLVSVYEMSIGRSLGLTSLSFRGLGDSERLELLRLSLVKARVLHMTTDPKTLAGIVRVFGANIRTTYSPAAAFSGEVYAVGASSIRSQVARHRRIQAWRSHAPRIQFEQVGGNHMSLLKEPHVDELAGIVRRAVEAPSGAGAGGHRTNKDEGQGEQT